MTIFRFRSDKLSRPLAVFVVVFAATDVVAWLVFVHKRQHHQSDTLFLAFFQHFVDHKT